MQKVNFNSIDEFLEYLPENELAIVEFLRNIVLDNIPGCQEKLAYNVPYFYKYTNICFIWPSSIPWGNVTHKGVRFGFTRGNLLKDELNYLDKGNRKQVYCRDFSAIREIDVPLLKAYLFEAVMVDEELAKSKLK